MSYENIIYAVTNRIARITLNRPKVLNALSPELLIEANSAVEAAVKDDSVGVIVMTGAGRAFSAGVDLASLGKRKLENGNVGSVLDDPARKLINTLQSVPKPVIAMVNGYCLTGALEVALNCDLIVASEEAKFGDTHTKWGLRPSWGMSQRLPRIIGVLKAKELSYTADIITAQEALRFGLINRVVPAERLEAEVLALAQKILANSPGAIAAYKYLYDKGLMLNLEEGLALEAKADFAITDREERIGTFGKG